MLCSNTEAALEASGYYCQHSLCSFSKKYASCVLIFRNEDPVPNYIGTKLEQRKPLLRSDSAPVYPTIPNKESTAKIVITFMGKAGGVQMRRRSAAPARTERVAEPGIERGELVNLNRTGDGKAQAHTTSERLQGFDRVAQRVRENRIPRQLPLHCGTGRLVRKWLRAS